MRMTSFTLAAVAAALALAGCASGPRNPLHVSFEAIFDDGVTDDDVWEVRLQLQGRVGKAGQPSRSCRASAP